MNEIESKLHHITENHKIEFLSKLNGQDGLRKYFLKYNLLAEYTKELSDRLINTANQYFKEEKEENVKETKELIKRLILDFWGFVKQY